MKRSYTLPADASTLRSQAARARWGPRDEAGRFWAKVDKNGPPYADRGPCWIWTGALTPAGYGSLTRNYVRMYAHRVAYEELVGPIAAQMEIDHLCRNPRCVNPAHLEVVTGRINRERIRRDYHDNQFSRLTHCAKGHPFDEANTSYTPQGWRRCRACSRARQQAYQQRKARKDRSIS